VRSLVNAISFIKFFQGEKTRFHHVYIRFTVGLGASGIRCRIDHLRNRYYDILIGTMEYFDSLSLTIAEQKNNHSL
jgi:hypothetical protein